MSNRSFLSHSSFLTSRARRVLQAAVLLILTLSTTGFAADWYVAPSAQGAGDCTSAAACTGDNYEAPAVNVEASITAPPTAAVVYVDADFSGSFGDPVNFVGNPGPGCAAASASFGADAVASITEALDRVSSGGTVCVAPGQYVEADGNGRNLVIGKPVALYGAQAGVDARNRSDAGASVIIPAVQSNPGYDGSGGILVRVASDDVVISGFVFDGDNTALTSGLDMHGADPDVAFGIAATGSDILFHDNVVRNLVHAGFYGYNYPTSLPAGTGNVVRHNWFYNMDAPSDWGVGVMAGYNYYADIDENLFDDVRIGVQTNYFNKSAVSGTDAFIRDNEIHASTVGVFFHYFAQNSSPFEVSGNQVFAVDNPHADQLWIGIAVSAFYYDSFGFVHNNQIDAVALTGSGRASVGYRASLITTSQAGDLAIEGGSVRNVRDGVLVTDGGFYPGAVDNITVRNVSFESLGRAAFLVEDTLPAGSETTDHVPLLTIGAGNGFINVPHQAAVSGAQAGVAYAPGAPMLESILALGANAGHRPGKEDNNGNVREAANAVIMDGLALLAPGGVLTVGEGTFDENVEVDKAATLRGPFAGTHGDDASRGGSDEAVIDADGNVGIKVKANDVTLDGLTITKAGSFAAVLGGGRNNVQVQNMRLVNSASNGIYIDGPNATNWLVRDNLMEDLHGSNKTAILIYKADGLQILNNVVRDVTYQGVQLSNAENVEIRGNGISGAAKDGVNVAMSTNLTIADNMIDTASTSRSGIRLYANVGGAAVFCNRIDGSVSGIGGFELKDGQGGDAGIFHNAVLGGTSIVSGWSDGVDIGSNWYGGANATTGGSQAAGVRVADPLAADPIGHPDCGDNTPVEVVAYSGDGQSVAIDTAFASNLSARVQDVLGGAVMNQPVSFSAPASGPSAVLHQVGGNGNYNGELAVTATANSTVGSYGISAQSGAFSTMFTLTNAQGAALVILSDPAPSYDGQAHSADFTTDPAGLEGDVKLTYSDNGTVVMTCVPGATGCGPTEAGSYTVTTSIVNHPSYLGGGTGTLTIQRAASTIVLDELNFEYDGSTHPVTAHLQAEPASTCPVSGTVGPDVGSYAISAAACDGDNYHAPAASDQATVAAAPATVTFDPLSGPYGTAHTVTVTLDPADSNASCDPVAGVPAQDAPVGTYTVSASCASDNYTASATASYEVTASSVSLSPVDAAPVGVVTSDPLPDAAGKMSYYSWDSSGTADELVRADFVVTSAAPNAQAGDLEAEWLDPSDNNWKPLPMQFDSASRSWSGTFGPTTGFEPGLGASDFRVAFHRGGQYVFDAGLIGVDSGLTLAESDPVVTEVAEIVLDGAMNLASRVGEPVESAVTLSNTGTAALSSGAIPVVPDQSAPNDENVRGRFAIHWDGGALMPADPNGPGGNGSNCGAQSCASPDVGVEYYDADLGEYVGIYNLRQTVDGEGLYGHFGSLAGGGLPVPAGFSMTNLFRTTAYQHTGTYTVTWQVVGLDSGTVYAEGPTQSIGIDEGEGAFVRIVSGDSGQAVVGGNAYDFGDLAVEVLNTYYNPVPGATVAFNVLPGMNGEGASLSIPAVTDADGQTSIQALSNDIAGVFEISAKLSGGATLDLPFALQNLADDDPAQVEISAHSGDGQTAQVGTNYALPLVVEVSDRFGNALQGVAVEFVAPAAGASAAVASASGTTDASGQVGSGVVTANNTAGSFAVTANADAGQCTGPTCTVGLGLTNTAGGVDSMTLTSSVNQAEVGTVDAYELTARVLDADGNPVPGVSVTLIGPSAAAGVEPAIVSGLTTTDGELLYNLDANTVAGAFDVQAVVSGASAASVSLENLASDAAAIEMVSGSGQSTPVNTAFGADLVVRVIDQYGNAVADDAAAEVSFSAPASGAGASVDAAATSGNDGLASTSATANGEVGSYSVVANFDGMDVNFALANTTGSVTISDIVWADNGADSIEWDGAARAATATVNGSSQTPTFSYNGSSGEPSDAGSYQVIATIDDGNVQGSASATLTITPAQAGGSGIVLNGGAYTYDGASHPAAVANPNGVAHALSYNTPDGLPPANAGSWTAVLEVIDPNYASEVLTAAIEIEKVVPQLYLFDLEHDADGQSKEATVVVLPEALGDDVVVTYDPANPISAGSYEVTAVIENHPNAEDASVTGTMIIHAEGPCSIFCDRFEADAGLTEQIPHPDSGEGSAQTTATWHIAAPAESMQRVALEILDERKREIAWIDTATAGDQQWIRLRHLDAGGRQQHSDWLRWTSNAGLGIEWDRAPDGEAFILRFETADSVATGLKLPVSEDRPLPHGIRTSTGN